MAALTPEELRRVGVAVSPETFDALVAEAVRRLPTAPPLAAPPRDFTDGEVAALRRAGAAFDSLPAGLADDPVARDIAEYAALLASALTPREVATRLGVDVSRIYHRLKERTLYGVRTGEGWRLPLFQFDLGGGGFRDVPGLGPVLAALDPAFDPLAVQGWLTAPDPDLEVAGRAVSPREWLLRGGAPDAIAPLDLIV